MKLSLVVPLLLSQLNFEGVKEEIRDCEYKLESAKHAQEKSELYYRLSQAYFLDQERDKAFEFFLLALEMTPFGESLCDDPLYQEAFAFYQTATPQEMIEKYAKRDTENIALNFLLATGYANLGEFDRFFTHFYKGYPHFKESYLAYKTQGIMWLHLAQRSTDVEEKRLFQKRAVEYFRSALDQYPEDAGLYRLIIFLAHDEKNEAMMLSYLQKLVDHQIAFTRGDIFFYVRTAVELKKFAVAKRILARAKELYDYSKAISAAEELLLEVE
ncbi:MAG: hypothetical protein ACKVOH_02335 [Chlamydiales bacterium]